jgi:hypothetical protein
MQFAAFTKRTFLIVSFLGILSFPLAAQPKRSAAAVSARPETVEWVYRIRYGFGDEWFQIFHKYQIAILERQKQLGSVLDYTVWAPSLHMSEESRWDYRVVITRVSHEAPPGQSEAEVAKQLFPDRAAFKRDENRRWSSPQTIGISLSTRST